MGGAMKTVIYCGREVSVRPGETVLEALEREGCEPPSSCRTGVCQSCLLRAVDGEPPESAQRGLRAPLKSRGYFLPCVCEPDENLAVVRPGRAEETVDARIVDRRRTGVGVAVVTVEPADSFAPRGGQFVNLIRGDGVTRAYSVANLPDRDGVLELHVRKVPGGEMSEWLHDGPIVGRSVELRGPAGECVYPRESDRPLLLVGTGTGLAPLVGVLRDADRHDHDAPVVLVHGVRGRHDHYYGDELKSLDDACESLDLQICKSSERTAVERRMIDRLLEATEDVLADVSEPVAYVCGPPDDARRLQKELFLAGVPSDDILSDPFVGGFEGDGD